MSRSFPLGFIIVKTVIVHHKWNSWNSRTWWDWCCFERKWFRIDWILVKWKLTGAPLFRRHQHRTLPENDGSRTRARHGLVSPSLCLIRRSNVNLLSQIVYLPLCASLLLPTTTQNNITKHTCTTPNNDKVNHLPKVSLIHAASRKNKI